MTRAEVEALFAYLEQPIEDDATPPPIIILPCEADMMRAMPGGICWHNLQIVRGYGLMTES